MSDIPTPAEVATALAAIDVSSRPQFAVARGDLEEAAAMIRRLDAALRRPLERVDYPDGWFNPRMFDDVSEDATFRDLKVIARSHGYDVVLKRLDQDDEQYARDGDSRAMLARLQPPDRLDDGHTLCGAWEVEDGDLVLAYLKPAGGEK